MIIPTERKYCSRTTLYSPAGQSEGKTKSQRGLILTASKLVHLAKKSRMSVRNRLLTLCKTTSCLKGNRHKICETSTSSHGNVKRRHLLEKAVLRQYSIVL